MAMILTVAHIVPRIMMALENLIGSIKLETAEMINVPKITPLNTRYVLYGLSKENGLALATYIHGTQLILKLILGGISFIIMLVKSPKIDRK